MQVTMARVNELIKHIYSKGYRATIDGRIKTPDGSERSLHLRKNNYYSFTCRDEKGCISVEVHKFIAYQIFGEEALSKGVHVRHLDGDSTNNCFDNLALGTPTDNIMDRDRADRVQHALHAAKSTRKLSSKQISQLRKDRQEGFTYSELMNKYGIAKSTVSYIVNEKTYSTI